MKQAATRDLFSYWDNLRSGREARLDAAPPHVRSALSNTFLIEVDARRAYPLRVIGGTLGKLTANARLGASFLECWDQDSQALVEAMLRVVHDEGHPVVLGALTRAAGHAPVPVEGLLLPLATNSDGKPRILGGLMQTAPLHSAAPHMALEIVSARAVRERNTPPASPSVIAPQPQQPLRLRVIKGGRTLT